MTEFKTLDKLLSEDLRLLNSLPIQVIPPESARCALKIWNAVELARFLKANLNPVVADVEATSDDCETQQRWKRKSKSSTSGEKPKSAKTPTANQRVKCLY